MSDTDQDPQTADVIVVGSGAGGLATAFTAAEQGASVIVLEKGSITGGTTAKSHGATWIPNNRWQRERGIDDTREDALKYMARTARPARFDETLPTLGLLADEYERLEAFYDNANEALEYLIEEANLLFIPGPDFPDYSSILEEGPQAFSRTLIPMVRDAAGELVDGSGSTLIEQLETACLTRNVRILTDHRVNGIVRNNEGTIVGVTAEAGGELVSFTGHHGVVFASGGFTQDAVRRENFLAGPILGGCAAITNEGDFLDISERLGLPLRNMNYGWFCPIPLEGILSENPTVRSIFTAQGDSMLWVNKYGARTLNEKAPYNEVTRTMIRWDQRRREYPDLLQFPVWDQRAVELSGGHGMGNYIPGPDDPRWSEVVVADTLEDLADKLAEKIDTLRPAVGGVHLADDFADQLRASIERFNEFASNGIDEDFGRGEAPIESYFHNQTYNPEKVGTAEPAKSTMYPLSLEGPFYATVLAAGLLDTKGGPLTDTIGRVLGAGGESVTGLYGVGNCVASPSGEGYWAAGGTIGPILTAGYVLGRHLAACADQDAQLAGSAALTV